MKDRCNECRYKMERHGIIEGEDVYYCDICGIYQTYPLEEEEALLAAEKGDFFKPLTQSEMVTISCDKCKHEEDYSTKDLVSFNEKGFPTCSKCYPKFNQGVDKPNSYSIIREHSAAEKKNCGCGQDPCITFGAEVDCPPATQDAKINARNQKQAFDKFGYGPRNVKEPEDYWEQMAEFWEVSVEKAKEQNCGNCVAYDVSPRMKDCGVGENLGYCWMHNFQCQSARTCKTWAKGGPIKTDKESVEWQKRALGDVEKQAENPEKKPEKDHNCISCGHHSAHLKMGDDRFCYDCYHYAETFEAMIEKDGLLHCDACGADVESDSQYGTLTIDCDFCGNTLYEDSAGSFDMADFYAENFNSYKVAPELSSYTVDELVDSIAGPQGSASYDEMVYDPIAQDRLSAESISIPHTVLLLGSIVAGLGFGVFLTKKLGDKTSDKGGA